jgi:hypothetical protein
MLLHSIDFYSGFYKQHIGTSMKHLLHKFGLLASIAIAIISIGTVAFASYRGYIYATEDRAKIEVIQQQMNSIHIYIATQAVRDSSLLYSFDKLRTAVSHHVDPTNGLMLEKTGPRTFSPSHK